MQLRPFVLLVALMPPALISTWHLASQAYLQPVSAGLIVPWWQSIPPLSNRYRQCQRVRVRAAKSQAYEAASNPAVVTSQKTGDNQFTSVGSAIDDAPAVANALKHHRNDPTFADSVCTGSSLRLCRLVFPPPISPHPKSSAANFT